MKYNVVSLYKTKQNIIKLFLRHNTSPLLYMGIVAYQFWYRTVKPFRIVYPKIAGK